MAKIPCNDSLRYRALAKAKGDSEIHSVSQYCMWYANACEDGHAEKAERWKTSLEMFVNTTLSFTEVASAVSRQLMSTGAKRILRTKRKLGREFTSEERSRIQKLIR